MNKLRTILVAALVLVSSASAFAQMSDKAVVAYITEAASSGKSKSQIANELLAKGVSTTQLQRIMQKYQAGDIESKSSSTDLKNASKESNTARKRNSSAPRTVSVETEQEKAASPVKKDTVKVEEDNPLFYSNGEKRIYGQNLFRNSRLSFEPNENGATPDSYVLGPGDEITIDVWGVNETTITEEITPEGRIFISQVGPVQLSGLTIKQATGKIRSVLKSKYSSVGGSASQISVTLSKIRTIQVNVMGEVMVPGTYRLSSFTTAFNAIYKAGGLTKLGSMRSIKVVRGGDVVAEADLYALMFDGKNDLNVSLREGDVVIVPPYQNLVGIDGGIKRPMFYEIRPGETLDKLIYYAGGYTENGFSSDASVSRDGAITKSITTVSAKDYDRFALQDRDMIKVLTSTDEKRFTNKVEISGCVYRPGEYAISDEIRTVKQLVERAGGLRDDAFHGRAQIIREKLDRNLEVLAVPIGDIVSGATEDVMLRGNDVVLVSSKIELEKKGDFVITGYVQNPGSYQFAENTSVEDLIMLAGGLVSGASTCRVDVSRRMFDNQTEHASDTLALVYSFPISEGLVVDKGNRFVLAPDDVVSVRRNPSYVEQRIVTVSGEVAFPGQYALISTDERVSDLIERAGGINKNGNVRGGMLRRQINDYERNVRKTLALLVKQNSHADTVGRKYLVASVFNVGIDLEKALQYKGSDYDIILRDNDEIIVPEKSSTVRIQGEILFPNTVQYVPGKSLRYYIKRAGGFSNRAKRCKTFVIYMNGLASSGLGSKVEPGCEIVVPSKAERREMSPAEVVSMSNSIVSTTALIGSMINGFIPR